MERDTLLRVSFLICSITVVGVPHDTPITTATESERTFSSE